MASLSKRVASLLKSVVNGTIEDLEKSLKENSNIFDEKISKGDEKANPKPSEESVNSKERTAGGNTFKTNKDTEKSQSYPQQLINDLKLFDLSPPSCLEAVKKVRNKEIKKYHPDKFVRDTEKAENAKRILQIYNSAYERLKRFYLGQ